ncbi:2-dehydropantoate 2-reductase [Kribbella deserti]|uniref:2-dehydropantoate 2-reductase n=1 Tax=Kribbella deserti TaxID=1926257 RepID=A0ABV6QML4_9ACTN
MKICVYGAGGIGCYVGGRLAASGSDVTFVGRPRLAAEVASNGLRLTDFRGAELRVNAVRFEVVPEAAAEADLVLVTVKSAGTATAGAELAKVLKPDAVVVSFQNGLRNASVLRAALPGHRVVTGMVPFNVLNRGDGVFHQGTEGFLDVEPGLSSYAPAFEAAGLPLTEHADMAPVQWAKLLLNLNNPINALSDLPLRDELSQRGYRLCLAAAQSEALVVLKAAGIEPAQLTAVPARLMPRILRLPDWLFRRLAGRMLAIDPLARSSMWEDLQAGRPTEIDYLNGEITTLGASLGIPTPINTRITTLIHQSEQTPTPYPAATLLHHLTAPS